MSSITVKWLGHSCFKLTCGNAGIVIDPYDKVEGYPELKAEANMVLTSHDHGDHGYVQAVGITTYNGEFPFEVKRVMSFHDDCGGEKRGKNVIHVITSGGLEIVHLGDLGHRLSKEQLEEIGKCDLLLVPVGGFFTIDAQMAKTVCDDIKPRVIIPMHYRRGSLGFDKIAEVEDFTCLYPQGFVRMLDTDTFDLTEGTEPLVAVLTFKG